MTDLKDSPAKCKKCGLPEKDLTHHPDKLMQRGDEQGIDVSDFLDDCHEFQSDAAALPESREQYDREDDTKRVLDTMAKEGMVSSDVDDSREMPGQRSERSMVSEYLAQQLSMSHDYLSTACFHGQCSDCRITCKFCSTKCSHICHAASAPSGNVGSQPALEGTSAPFAASRFYETWMHEGTGDRERWVLNHPFGAWHFKFAEQFAQAYADRSIAPLRERLEKSEAAYRALWNDRDAVEKRLMGHLASLREQAKELAGALEEVEVLADDEGGEFDDSLRQLKTIHERAEAALLKYRESKP